MYDLLELAYVWGLEEQLRLHKNAKRLILNDMHRRERTVYEAKMALRTSNPELALDILEGRKASYLVPKG